MIKLERSPIGKVTKIQIDQVWVSALYSVKKFIGNFFFLISVRMGLGLVAIAFERLGLK